MKHDRRKSIGFNIMGKSQSIVDIENTYLNESPYISSVPSDYNKSQIKTPLPIKQKVIGFNRTLIQKNKRKSEMLPPHPATQIDQNRLASTYKIYQGSDSKRNNLEQRILSRQEQQRTAVLDQSPISQQIMRSATPSINKEIKSPINQKNKINLINNNEYSNTQLFQRRHLLQHISNGNQTNKRLAKQGSFSQIQSILNQNFNILPEVTSEKKNNKILKISKDQGLQSKQPSIAQMIRERKRQLRTPQQLELDYQEQNPQKLINPINSFKSQNIEIKQSPKPLPQFIQRAESSSPFKQRQQISHIKKHSAQFIYRQQLKDAIQFQQQQQQKPIEQFLKIACLTQKGQLSSNSTKVNQDAFIIKRKLQDIDNLQLIAVADGHGTNGHLVAKQISNNLIQDLEFEDRRMVKTLFKGRSDINSIFQQIDIPEQIEKFKQLCTDLLKKVFQNMNQIVEQQKQFDIQFSGSTLVLAIIHPKFVIVANCGDSKCLLIQNNLIILETVDHKPEFELEKQRICHQYKGRVSKTKQIKNVPENNESDKGVFRVWSQIINLPGLAMSRSIGDSMAKTLGVIYEPDIYFHFQKENNQNPTAIIVATDGLWDAPFTCQEFVEFLNKLKQNSNLNECVSKIYQEALRRWQNQEDNLNQVKMDIDDITFVLGFFTENQQ